MIPRSRAIRFASDFAARIGRDRPRSRSQPREPARIGPRRRLESACSVTVFLVQVAGYQDTIVPEFYDRTYILGGWSDGLLRFAAQMGATNVFVAPA